MTAYDLEMQERYDDARAEEASPTLMPIEQIAYRYIHANAQHQDTHVEGEQCDACAQHARALHSQIATVVAVVVREETASDLDMLADYHQGLSADWLDGVRTARKIIVEKADEERDYISPENLALMDWADLGGSR
jgi:hypothetical protein